MQVLTDDYRQDDAIIGRLILICKRQMRVSLVVIRGGVFTKRSFW